ncbi:Helix-turn-helix domain-containing protein [Chryseobacterium ureilyticum]|uniref:Helix-turn-helix domain-containing protein n=1 Tax=Chryseobacterium ureilyticum TaxID=373668 RepID=A0A1N7LES1_9FLAO|nr:helix-turn-helix domain-containing protein [Chryseobacterium ureilyticum]SIS72286.1 Helix-turn-helix domain-containing protein [Chryseobacterium ureilyticum]
MQSIKNATDEILSRLKDINAIKKNIQQISKYLRPSHQEEKYLTGVEVSRLLHISRRTLQQYRDDSMLPFVKIQGKILYKESDILNLLDNNYKGK